MNSTEEQDLLARVGALVDHHSFTRGLLNGGDDILGTVTKHLPYSNRLDLAKDELDRVAASLGGNWARMVDVNLEVVIERYSHPEDRRRMRWTLIPWFERRHCDDGRLIPTKRYFMVEVDCRDSGSAVADLAVALGVPLPHGFPSDRESSAIFDDLSKPLATAFAKLVSEMGLDVQVENCYLQ